MMASAIRTTDQHNKMNIVNLSLIAYALLSCLSAAAAQTSQVSQNGRSRISPLEIRVDHFDVTDGVFRDAISMLSLKNIKDLHLGFEEIIRDRIQDDERTQSPHFSFSTDGKTVRELLDELCNQDIRYTWSMGGTTINIYPRSSMDDRSYLLNQWIQKIAISNVPDPDQALTAPSKLFPDQQVGYFGPGLGNNAYAQPWTNDFEDLTVRQFINKLAEHMGSQTSWIWQGGRGERMFSFLKGGFHTR
jgi:hypothetical protein